MGNVFFSILCAIAILILIAVAILNFDIFTSIVNSASYSTNNASKTAHTYFLISFVIIILSIIIFVLGIAIIGYEKISHLKLGNNGKKFNVDELMSQAKKLIYKIKNGSGTSEDIGDLKRDEAIIKTSSSDELKFTIVLFIIAMLSLVTLILTCIGQYYLGQAKSSQNDSFLSKAYNEAWFSIGLSLLSLIIVLIVVGIKIKTYASESKLVKSAMNTLKSIKG